MLVIQKKTGEHLIPEIPQLRLQILARQFRAGQGITVLQLNLQAAGVAIPVEYLAMSPYLITIVVLVILSADKSSAPAALGRNFHASR